MIEFSRSDPSSSEAVPAQILSQLVPPISRVQMAIVAPGDLEFGIARRFQAIYELPEDVFAVFRDEKKALAWFGLENNLVEWSAWRSVLGGCGEG